MAEITLKQFNNPKILAEIERSFELNILLPNDIKEAFRFVQWLEPIFENASESSLESSGLLERYQNLILKCKFIALALLTPKEIEELFERHITVLFQLPDYYDLWPRLKVKLVAMPIYEERDDFKKKLREALLRNQEFLTPEVSIKEDNREKAPTVENWLRNYIFEVGMEPAETVKRSGYLVKNKNIQKLEPGSRKKLEQLIILFERLKLSSLTPAGLEENVLTEIGGRLTIFREGRLEPIDQKSLAVVEKLRRAGFFPSEITEGLPETTTKAELSNEEIATKLTRIYRGAPEFNAKIKKAEEELLKITNREINKIKAEINKAIGAKEDFKLIAGVRILIRNNKLNFLWQENEELKVNFRPWLVKLGNEYGLNNEKLLDDFMAKPDQPIYFKEFLRYSLEGKIGYQENMAAQIGLQMGSLLAETGRKEFETMAYFDEASGEVRWTANKKTPQGLLTLPSY